MNATDTTIYRACYDLHRLYYETPEEARDADFWGQIKDGIHGLGKFNAQGAIVKLLALDVLTAYEKYSTYKRLQIDMAQAEATKRAHEEATRIEAETRTKAQAEVTRLERELAKARAAL